MSKPKLAIDFDDVLFATAKKTIDHYNQCYGTTLTEYHFNNKESISAWGNDINQIMSRINEFLGSSEAESIQPIDGAIESVKLLNKYFELHIVTARDSSLTPITHKMTDEHFPNIFKSIHFASPYSDNPKTKAEILKDLGAIYLIDDNPENAQSVANENIPVVLFGDYIWQKDFKLHQNIKRALTWPATEKILIFNY